MMIKWGRLAVCVFGMALILGCASERIVLNKNSYSDTRLIQTRSGTEEMLAWDSKAGFAYTIVYRLPNDPKKQWRILPGFDRIRGTGRRLTYKINVPANENRTYRIKTYPAVSLAN